jgi:hypothetical protein
LFIDLPFGVVPLLAANLLYAAGSAVKVDLLEFRRDAQGREAGQLYFVVAWP